MNEAVKQTENRQRVEGYQKRLDTTSLERASNPLAAEFKVRGREGQPADTHPARGPEELACSGQETWAVWGRVRCGPWCPGQHSWTDAGGRSCQ